MGVFKNINYKQYFKRYGIYNGIKRLFFMKKKLYLLNDSEFIKLLYYKKCYKKLLKFYNKYRNKEPENLRFGEVKFSKEPIWIYWNSGLSNAPKIVKQCIDSCVKHNGNKYEIIILSDDNLSKYLVLPSNINNEKMSAAAYSDLIRFSLLEHYGGIWVDSTVFFSDTIPSFIDDSDYFCFLDECHLIDNKAELTSWFIKSKKSCIIAYETRNLLFEYWKMNHYVNEYLLCYILATISFEHNNQKLNFPKVSSYSTRMLFEHLDKKSDDYLLKWIFSNSNIHKLSYKLQDNVYLDDGNIYHRIVGE